MKAGRILLLVTSFCLIISILSAGQSVPQLINYQGRLTDDTGQPVDGTTVDILFRFYGDPVNNNPLYLSVTQYDVLVTGGIYSVLIGSGTIVAGDEKSLADVFQKHPEVWMGVNVDGSWLTPRQRITSVPYSMAVDLNFIEVFRHTPDWDGDGYDKDILYGGLDCNDADPMIKPGAPDTTVDGIDQNCDGVDGIPVYIFESTQWHNGDLGGRSGADSVCTVEVLNYPGLPTSKVKGFLSFSATDEIRDMPMNYGVPIDNWIVGPTRKKIASNWADLLDGNLEMSLFDAEIMSLSTHHWLSGSSSDGAIHANNCEGWTTARSTVWGRLGSPTQTNYGWIDNANTTCDYGSRRLLCIAWW